MLAFALRASCVVASSALLACSGGDFSLGDAGDAAASDTAPSADSAPADAPASDASEDSQGGGSNEGGTVEGGPPCEATLPAVTCPGGAYASQFDLSATTWLSPRLTHSVSHALSFVQQAAGRTEKIHLRLRRSEAFGATEGTFKVTAWYAPCETVAIKLAEHVRPAAEVSGEMTFYFNPSVPNGAPYLPYLPAGATLIFTVETNSTRWSWDVGGRPKATDNPFKFSWATKTGAGTWVEHPAQIVAAMSYLRACN